MKQIEILEENKENLYQTFIIDNRHDFPYYRPLYLIGRVKDDKAAAKAAKSNYFINCVSLTEWTEANKQIKVIAKPANREKDIEIANYIDQFNNAKNIPSRTASEIAHRITEEKINELIINY